MSRGAAAREILITKEAMDMIPGEANVRGREMSVSVSGLNITAYSISITQEPK